MLNKVNRSQLPLFQALSLTPVEITVRLLKLEINYPLLFTTNSYSCALSTDLMRRPKIVRYSSTGDFRLETSPRI